MRASTLMLVAIVLYLVHRWATNQKTVTPQIAVQAAFAVLVIALLDQGETEPVAKGFAWLFVVVAAYTALPSIAKASSTSSNPNFQSVLKPKGRPVVDKADIKTGFFIAVGVLLALFLWGLVSGQLGRLRG